MRTMKIILLAALCSATTVFASAPEWVTGNADQYPGEVYLVGRGTGATAEEAQNRARGDLATIFEVRVEVVTENTTTVAKTGDQELVNKRASQQVSASTDKVISGITIPEIWRDPSTMDFHALAVLPRAKAAAGLREEIQRIDDNVEREVTAAKSATDPLQKIGALARAREAAVNRDGFEASLRVVGGSGLGIAAPIPQAEVQAQMNAALKSVRIAPEVTRNADADEFATILKGGIAAAGFLAKNSTDVDYLLVGGLTLNDLGRKGNWHWMRGTIEISLVEKQSRTVRGSKTWPIKSSAQDAKTARSRVLIEVEKKLKQDLQATLIEFASN